MTKRFSRHEPEVSAGQSLESRLKKASPLRARSRSHPRRARARSNAHETRSIDAEDSTPPARTSTPARLVRGAESQMIPRSTRSAPAPDADDVAVAAFDRSTRAIERRDAARAMERREKTRPRSVRSRASRTARAPRSSATTSPVHRRVRRARSGRVGVPRGKILGHVVRTTTQTDPCTCHCHTRIDARDRRGGLGSGDGAPRAWRDERERGGAGGHGARARARAHERRSTRRGNAPGIRPSDECHPGGLRRARVLERVGGGGSAAGRVHDSRR